MIYPRKKQVKNLCFAQKINVRNIQQDIIGILDKEGTRIVFYTYDSWGKLMAVTGSKKDSIGQKNPFQYRGYYYDVESGAILCRLTLL